MKKLLIPAVVIIVILLVGFFALNSRRQILSFEDCAAAGYPVGESYPRQCWTPDGKHFAEKIEGTPSPEPITITGKISCLPKVGDGPQTLECALGLLGDDGNYYGLKNLSEVDPNYMLTSANIKLEVTGTLVDEEMKGPDGNLYDIVGTIEVASAKEAEQPHKTP